MELPRTKTIVKGGSWHLNFEVLFLERNNSANHVWLTCTSSSLSRKKWTSRVEGVQVDELCQGSVAGARPAGGGARPRRQREEGALTDGGDRWRWRRRSCWWRRSSVGVASMEHVEIAAALERGSRGWWSGSSSDGARAGRQKENKATLDVGVWERAAWLDASSRRPARRPARRTSG